MRLLLLLAATTPLLASCTKDDPPDVVLDFTPGKETSAWAAMPVPASMVVRETQVGESPTSILSHTWPVDTVTMGSLTAGASYSFSAEFLDATGATVMRGLTPVMSSDDVSGTEVPVLCGRVGELARPDEGLTLSWTSPFAVYASSRFAFLANGAQQTEIFDFVYLEPFETTSTLPIVPTAMAPVPGNAVLMVTASDVEEYSLEDGSTGVVATGLDPATLSGASAIIGDDGTAYLVGATRTGDPTTSVLRIATDGTVTAHALSTARSQAAAAWVSGTGLVVVGGAATDTAEVLGPSADAFSVVSANVPQVHGGVAVSVASQEILLAGSLGADGTSQPVMRISLACSPCAAPAMVADAIDLPSGQGFPVGAPNGFLVGAAANGTTAAYEISEATNGVVTVTSVQLKAPRAKSAAIPLGDGRVAIVGGVDSTGVAVGDIEVFTPP